MYSSELDRAAHPLAERGRAIVLSIVIGTTVAAGLVSARTLPYGILVLVVLGVSIGLRRGSIDRSWWPPDAIAVQISLFLGFAALSALWAVEPVTTLTKVGLAVVIGIGSWAMIKLVTREQRPDLLFIGEGLYVGLLIGLTYFLIELLTGQGIKLWLYRTLNVPPEMLKPASNFVWAGGKLLAIKSFDLTRNAAPITLFLWPAIMVMRGSFSGWPRLISPLLLFALAVAVVMLSPHETSKIALAAGVAAYVIAAVSLSWAGRVMIAGWVIACLAILPAALIAYRLDLHKTPWLQPSAQHRVVIWNTTAEQALKAPILGVGAEMTYVMGPVWSFPAPTETAQGNVTYQPSLQRHAHNVYLQTWFELGLVGVVLLTLTGTAILQRMRTLSAEIQPFAFATFASAGVVAGSSYGMWQIWFMAMFGLAAVFFVVAVTVLQTQPDWRKRSLPQAAWLLRGGGAARED